MPTLQRASRAVFRNAREEVPALAVLSGCRRQHDSGSGHRRALGGQPRMNVAPEVVISQTEMWLRPSFERL